jgi:hypothetical protein
MNWEAIVSAGWLLRLARYGFGIWCLLYGSAALVSPNTRIATSAINDVAIAIHAEPHMLLGAMFIIPGVMMLISRLQTIGLWFSTVVLCTYEIGLIISASRGDGTLTAPVTFGFIMALSAMLLSLRDIK